MASLHWKILMLKRYALLFYSTKRSEIEKHLAIPYDDPCLFWMILAGRFGPHLHAALPVGPIATLTL